MKNVWVSKDGTERKVSELEYSHARNCINLITRKLGANKVLDLLLDGINEHNRQVEIHNKSREIRPQGDIAQDMESTMLDYEYGTQDCYADTLAFDDVNWYKEGF